VREFVATRDRRLAPLREWRTMLLHAQREFEVGKLALDALPKAEQSDRFREVDAVRDALKVIRSGVPWVQS
jgi:hypothetical protein